MEVEELNALMELKAFDEASYERAMLELVAAGKQINPQNVLEKFEEYNIEAAAIFGNKELKLMEKSQKAKQPGE